MPSFSIWARSRTSHSRWNSEAMRPAASAMTDGVSRLAGSLTMARAKFCASATIRPRSTARLRSAAPLDGTIAAEAMDFLSLPVGSGRARNSPRIAPSTAADANSGRAMLRIEGNGNPLDGLRFQMANRGADEFPPGAAAPNSPGLPAPARRTRLAATPAGWWSNVNSSDLARDLAGFAELGGAEPFLPAAFENRHNQGVRGNLIQGLGFDRDLHQSDFDGVFTVLQSKMARAARFHFWNILRTLWHHRPRSPMSLFLQAPCTENMLHCSLRPLGTDFPKPVTV